MKHLKVLSILFTAICITLLSCDPQTTSPRSSSGVTKATVKVATDLSGHTTEQNNVMDRYKVDNLPGSIKHLYIISAYSGQVILYSTVRGKVTSSGKRLTPNTVVSGGAISPDDGFLIDINGQEKYTGEVLQDDGTYGSSVEYIYWFDSRGIYRQFYPSSGAILIISSQPLAVKGITINVEETSSK